MNPSEKRKKYGEKYAVWLRNYQRARGRALTRLAQAHPEEYQGLLEEEKARDLEEKKTWLDISGRTMPSSPLDRTTHDKIPTLTERQTNRDEDKARNLGGKA